MRQADIVGKAIRQLASDASGEGMGIELFHLGAKRFGKYGDAERKATQYDALTIETLRPWMRRFVALAPKETQRSLLSWDSDPQTTRLIEKAKE